MTGTLNGIGREAHSLLEGPSDLERMGNTLESLKTLPVKDQG